jgi:hypothetical protein
MGSIGSHRDEGFTGVDNQMRNHTRGDWNEEEGFRTWMMLTVNLAADRVTRDKRLESTLPAAPRVSLGPEFL